MTQLTSNTLLSLPIEEQDKLLQEDLDNCNAYIERAKALAKLQEMPEWDIVFTEFMFKEEPARLTLLLGDTSLDSSINSKLENRKEMLVEQLVSLGLLNEKLAAIHQMSYKAAAQKMQTQDLMNLSEEQRNELRDSENSNKDSVESYTGNV